MQWRDCAAIVPFSQMANVCLFADLRPMVTKFLASSMRSSVSSPESSSSRQPLTSPLPGTTSGRWSPDVTETTEGQKQRLLRSPKFIWAPCHVMYTAVLIGWDRETSPLSPHLDSRGALLDSKDRRHLFMTPCSALMLRIRIRITWAAETRSRCSVYTLNFSLKKSLQNKITYFAHKSTSN